MCEFCVIFFRKGKKEKAATFANTLLRKDLARSDRPICRYYTRIGRSLQGEGAGIIMAQLVKRGKDTWLIRVYLGKDVHGKRKTYCHTIHGTKAKAQEYAAKCEAQHKEGLLLNDVTFCEVWEQYIAACKGRLNANTMRSKNQAYKNHLCFFAGYKLAALKPFVVQEYVNTLIEQGYKGITIRKIISQLAACLEQCVKWQMLTKNPCKGLVLPKAESTLTSIKPLTNEELPKFMKACERSRYGLFYRLMLVTGARTSEIRALCWDCVNVKDHSITIKRGINHQTNKIQEGVKNTFSVRTLPIDDITLKSLLELRARTSRAAVFPGKKEAQVISTPTLQRELFAILKAAGIERTHFRLYDLRHSCASYLLRSGVPVRAVSDLLGHASAKMTLDTYNHAVRDLSEPLTAALKAIDEAAGISAG